ncbi:hypothetical protein B9Z55_023883 [Caenorhabditis nigoni]|uniref:Uncharacterized protein n=2 Tax=Caenorhabditis nigoni TaxID=1611254 RepID=A0A2G5SRM9_9PELO|nr:hypothetical protein B9Z55_023883 [Caenorhabditis nigoni]
MDNQGMRSLRGEITACLAAYIAHQQNLNRLLKLAHRNNVLKTDYVVETRLSKDDPVLPNSLFITPLPMTFAEEQERETVWVMIWRSISSKHSN